MSRIQLEFTKWAQKKESEVHNQGINRSIDTEANVAEMMELANKDIKIAIINGLDMLKDLKKK